MTYAIELMVLLLYQQMDHSFGLSTAYTIEQRVLLWYGQMEHSSGGFMADCIEQRVLLWYGQMDHGSGISMAKISHWLLKNGCKTKQFLGHGPMKKRG